MLAVVCDASTPIAATARCLARRRTRPHESPWIGPRLCRHQGRAPRRPGHLALARFGSLRRVTLRRSPGAARSPARSESRDRCQRGHHGPSASAPITPPLRERGGLGGRRGRRRSPALPPPSAGRAPPGRPVLLLVPARAESSRTIHRFLHIGSVCRRGRELSRTTSGPPRAQRGGAVACRRVRRGPPQWQGAALCSPNRT